MTVKSERIITREKAKRLDQHAQKKLGISVLLLMENAARGVAEEALKMIKDKKARVAVFCGKGNNGGDGFCAARHLLALGIKPDIFLAGEISEVRNEARVNLDILLRLKQKIAIVNKSSLDLLRAGITGYSLIIDALLGVGLTGKVSGVYGELIDLINESKACVLSVDIPSGLDATTGKIRGLCIKADRTVTFVAKKRGMLLGAGKKHCGNIVVKNLGIPL
jgi:NAD(P)H-hydrate epimerase